jgi:hypothetical protein
MKALVTLVTTPSKFYAVRERLEKIWPDRRNYPEIVDFDVVVGFCDIIIEALVENLQELFDKVINKLIDMPELSVLKTFISLPVGEYLPTTQGESSSPALPTRRETTTGYVFVSVVPERVRYVYKAVQGIMGVSSADLLLGEYDLVAKCTVPLYLLPRKIDEIQQIEGIKRTVTCLPVRVIEGLRPES